MKLSFDNDIAFAVILFFIVLAIAGSVLVYSRHRENRELSQLQKRMLAGLRLVSLFLVLLLFLKPVFVSEKKIKEKPVIVVAADNSQSLKKYAQQEQELSRQINERLKGKYQIDNWLFGHETIKSDTLSFMDGQSDYSQLLSSVSDQYINKNIGALIILGDGIYNTGQNPLNLADHINTTIYTVPLGDTTQIPDIRISELKHNTSVFLNNYFVVEADIHIEKLAGKTTRIELTNQGKVILSKTIPIPNNSFFSTESFTVQATEKGLQNYQLQIKTVENEVNTTNNQSNFTIRVIDDKHKILLLGDGPHPDMGTIKNELESFGNFEVSIVSGNSLPEDISHYDACVLYQLPSLKNNNSQALQTILKSKKPLLFVLGGKTSVPYLNNLQMGISSTAANGLNESQISINPDFSLFKLEKETKENLESFPPLYVPYADFTINDQLQVLGWQKIKGIPTPHPLLAIGKYQQRKVGFLLGEGIWRWRIFDYSLHQQSKTTDELIYKLFNYLCLNENDENFRLNYSMVYFEDEDIIIKAELFNDSYELINEPEVSLSLKKDSTNEFNFIFDKVNNSYTLNMGSREAGTYQLEAQVKLGDKTYTRTGNFRVVKLNLEQQQTVANHQLLYQLAYETGGKSYLPDQLDSLIVAVNENAKIKTSKFVQSAQKQLLDSKWVFVVLLLLLSLEWFLRKFWGIY